MVSVKDRAHVATGDASVVFPAGPVGEMEIRGLDSDGEVLGHL